MDLLKELEPYNRDLDLFNQGHGVTKHARDSVELRDIWRRLQIKEAKTIYGRADAAPIECKSCNPTMMKALVNWREIYKRKDTTYFKGVPQEVENGFDSMVEPDTLSTEVEDDIPDYVQPPETVYSMKWGEFKTYCKEQGLSVKGKTKKELLKELGI
jgi:hypothetical protein